MCAVVIVQKALSVICISSAVVASSAAVHTEVMFVFECLGVICFYLLEL